MAPGRQKRCLLVLGMHNSGTSLLSNLMHGAGISLGPNLLLRNRMPEQRRPPYDYYEDADIVRLQDETLLDLQRHWSSYRAAWPLPPAYHPSRELFRQKLQQLIPERLGRNSLWLVKDPRSAVLLEDWLLVLRQLNVEPRLLLVHRDPTSNIRSFSRKGRVPPLWAEALWQRTYQQALLAVSTLPDECWAITRFEDLLQQPQASVLELCEWLQHPINAKQRDQLAARVNQALPAFPPAPGSDQRDGKGLMHSATRALTEQLQMRSRNAPPKALLADELQEALADGTTPLELNRINTDGQTLLPKATVTIVSNELQGGGAEGGGGLESRALGTALASAGHRVTLLVIGGPTPAEAPELPGIQVHHLQGSDCNRPELLRRVASWLRDQPCDVVHLHDWPGLANGLRQALQPHPPQLIVGLSDAGKERGLELDGVQQADWLISPPQAMATWTEQHWLDGQRPEQLVVNQSCPLPQQLGPAETWRIELSWQAFHERLPRLSTDSAAQDPEEAKATTDAKDSTASPWRKLLTRIRGK
jgi:hypothetical protein